MLFQINSVKLCTGIGSAHLQTVRLTSLSSQNTVNFPLLLLITKQDIHTLSEYISRAYKTFSMTDAFYISLVLYKNVKSNVKTS